MRNIGSGSVWFWRAGNSARSRLSAGSGRAAFLAVLYAVPAFTATHAVLPGCCASPLYAFTVLNGTTGQVENEFTAPSTGAYGSAASLAIAKGGGRAVVVTDFTPYRNHEWIRVDLVNLDTGEFSGSVTTQSATSAGAVVDNLNGLIYVGYQSTIDNSGHIAQINPSTLKVTSDTQISCDTFLPGGGQIYCTTPSGIAVLKAETLAPIGAVSLAGAGNLALSPDGSVLYATYGDNVAFIDTTTLDVTQSVAVGPTWALAISPDGSELYFAAGGSLILLNTATLAQTSLPETSVYGIAVAQNGNIYWQNGNFVVVFDPATQTITATYPAPAGGGFTLDPVTAQLCFLTFGVTSTISATAADPSTAIARSAPLEGPFTGAYDRKDNLILLPDYQTQVEVLDAVSLKTKGFVSMPYGATAYQVLFSDEGGQGYTFIPNFGFGIGFAVVPFDPVALQLGNILQVPLSGNDNQAFLSQSAIHGTQLFVPYTFNCGGCYVPPPNSVGIALINTANMTLTTQIAIPNATGVSGFAISPGGEKGFLDVQYGYQGPYSLLEIDLQTGQILRKASIPTGNLTISPDGSTLYTNVPNGLEAISTQTLSVTNSAPSLNVGPIAVTPDGQYIYAPVTHGVDIISTNSLTVTGSIASSVQPQTPIFVEY